MCALSVLQKECRKVWDARYTLGARYRSENTVPPWDTVLDKLMCPFAVKLPALSLTQRFITVFTRASHLPLALVREEYVCPSILF